MKGIWSGRATGKAGGEKGPPHKQHKALRRRSRLDELTFGMFNVCTVVAKGVSGIGHIDTLLRPYAACGCDVIGLQETIRDETSEIVASGYRV